VKTVKNTELGAQGNDGGPNVCREPHSTKGSNPKRGRSIRSVRVNPTKK
jgi:hypothetical protein